MSRAEPETGSNGRWLFGENYSQIRVISAEITTRSLYPSTNLIMFICSTLSNTFFSRFVHLGVRFRIAVFVVAVTTSATWSAFCRPRFLHLHWSPAQVQSDWTCLTCQVAAKPEHFCPHRKSSDPAPTEHNPAHHESIHHANSCTDARQRTSCSGCTKSSSSPPSRRPSVTENPACPTLFCALNHLPVPQCRTAEYLNYL